MSSHVGGSAQHRPTRVRKPKISGEGKVLNANQRAMVKVGGELSYLEIKNSWSVLKVGNHQEDQEKGNGIIINLLNLGLSQIEIYSTLKCGANRIDKMRQRIAAGDSFVKPETKQPSHAFSAKTIQFLYSHMASWEPRLEQGFPCPHLRLKHYFVQEVGAPKITWKLLYEEYVIAFNLQSADDEQEEEACAAAVVEENEAQIVVEGGGAQQPKRKRKAVAPGARQKPGPKPRGVVNIDPGSPSIMAFYSKVDVNLAAP